MSDNKLLKTIMDAAVLTGLATGIGWVSKKVVKENMTADPSGNVLNYTKFTAKTRRFSKTRRFFWIQW